MFDVPLIFIFKIDIFLCLHSKVSLSPSSRICSFMFSYRSSCVQYLCKITYGSLTSDWQHSSSTHHSPPPLSTCPPSNLPPSAPSLCPYSTNLSPFPGSANRATAKQNNNPSPSLVENLSTVRHFLSSLIIYLF